MSKSLPPNRSRAEVPVPPPPHVPFANDGETRSSPLGLRQRRGVWPRQTPARASDGLALRFPATLDSKVAPPSATRQVPKPRWPATPSPGTSARAQRAPSPGCERGLPRICPPPPLLFASPRFGRKAPDPSSPPPLPGSPEPASAGGGREAGGAGAASFAAPPKTPRSPPGEEGGTHWRKRRSMSLICRRENSRNSL